MATFLTCNILEKGYRPEGRLDVKHPIGRSGVLSPPPAPQINVYIKDFQKNKKLRKSTDK